MRVTPDCDQRVYVVVNPNSDENQGEVWLDSVRNEVYVANPVHRIYQGWGEEAGFSGHLLLSFSQPSIDGDCYIGKYANANATHIKGMAKTGAWVAFDGKAGQPIEVRMASSFTSLGEMMVRAAEAWIDRFHTIDVEDADTAEVNQFYGALYRASFLPRLLSDADGAYPRFADGPTWLWLLLSGVVGYVIGDFYYTVEDGDPVPILETEGVYSFAMPGENVTLTAHFWQENPVVTFHCNKFEGWADTPEPQQLAIGGKAVRPADIRVNGPNAFYTFKG